MLLKMKTTQSKTIMANSAMWQKQEQVMRDDGIKEPWFKSISFGGNDVVVGKPQIGYCVGVGRIFNDSLRERIVISYNWHDEAREALTKIALLCEQDQDKTDWQDILRRANSALEHLGACRIKAPSVEQV